MNSKILASSAILVLSTPAFAKGVYFQVDGVYSNLNTKHTETITKNQDTTTIKHSLSNDTIIPRLSLGYDFGSSIRAAVDYTYNYGVTTKITTKTIIKSGSERENTLAFEGKFHSIGLSAFYDFLVHEQFNPYIGGRVSMRFNDADNFLTNVTLKEKGNQLVDATLQKLKDNSNGKYTVASSSAIGVAPIIGVSYQVNENAVLDAGYRFNYFFKNEEVLSSSHEFSVGARIKF